MENRRIFNDTKICRIGKQSKIQYISYGEHNSDSLVASRTYVVVCTMKLKDEDKLTIITVIFIFGLALLLMGIFSPIVVCRFIYGSFCG